MRWVGLERHSLTPTKNRALVDCGNRPRGVCCALLAEHLGNMRQLPEVTGCTTVDSAAAAVEKGPSHAVGQAACRLSHRRARDRMKMLTRRGHHKERWIDPCYARTSPSERPSSAITLNPVRWELRSDLTPRDEAITNSLHAVYACTRGTQRHPAPSPTRTHCSDDSILTYCMYFWPTATIRAPQACKADSERHRQKKLL